MKDEISFVSSYDESCGNAYFTGALVSSVSDKYKCRGVSIDLSLTQSVEKNTIDIADAHIKRICKDLAGARAVNIQVEPQLYGSSPNDILRRLNWLFSSNKNISATIHNARIVMPRRPSISLAKDIIRLRPIVAATTLYQYINARSQPSLNRSIVTLADKLNVSIIVHTERAKKNFIQMLGVNKVYVHPLKFPRLTGIERQHATTMMTNLRSSLGLPEGSISIGMFGYISQYKGHEEAIHALALLPKYFHLFIFGRQHPQSIRRDGGVDPYIERLINIIETKKLVSRVHFMGEYPPDTFAQAISAVDICWLPYREVGQDGSGIAAQCFDNAKRVICSASFAFDEALKIDKKDFVLRVDIGNFVQIANATLLAIADDGYLNNYIDNEFTVNSQRTIYLRSMGIQNEDVL